MHITKRLRGIWHAWHFQFALSLVVTTLCGGFCIACLHPLTRRYVLWRKKWKFAQTRNVGKHIKFLSLAQALLVVKS
ncbi:DUF3265 domain-containing protein [Vibrio vulnificus]|nr:DUF3265 domain-containing protein [Vibrio vulnificus]